MRATRQFTFEAAHRLPNHDGKCQRLHGHHYVVEVTVAGDPITSGPQTGMVLDFARIDAALAALIETWDHRTILWVDDPLWPLLLEADPESVVGIDSPPTAEYLAAFVGEMLEVSFDVRAVHVNVVEVVVRETPKGWATWRPS